jgi:hypothetical protein
MTPACPVDATLTLEVGTKVWEIAAYPLSSATKEGAGAALRLQGVTSVLGNATKEGVYATVGERGVSAAQGDAGKRR